MIHSMKISFVLILSYCCIIIDARVIPQAPRANLQAYLSGDNLPGGGQVRQWRTQAGSASFNVRGTSAPQAITSRWSRWGSIAPYKVLRFNRNTGMILEGGWSNIQGAYTITIMDRYTGGGYGRTLQSMTTNWLLGKWAHRNGHYAVGWLGNFYANTEWTVQTATRQSNGLAEWFVNDRRRAVKWGKHAPGRLALGRSGRFKELSDFEVGFIAIWNRKLSSGEILNLHRTLNRRYAIWSAPPRPPVIRWRTRFVRGPRGLTGPRGRNGKNVPLSKMKQLVREQMRKAVDEAICNGVDCSGGGGGNTARIVGNSNPLVGGGSGSNQAGRHWIVNA